MVRLSLVAAAVAVVTGVSLVSDRAFADVEYAPKEEGPRASWHPRYGAELEAHAAIAAFDQFFVGMGGGARATIPAWRHVPFKGFDNEFGVTVGFDFIRYSGYQPGPPSDERKVRLNTYYVPIGLQWSAWVGSAVSIFIEPTLLYRFGTYIDSCPTDLTCAKSTRLLPTGSIGLRFRITDHVAGTFRAGWPMATLGVSWL